MFFFLKKNKNKMKTKDYENDIRNKRR